MVFHDDSNELCLCHFVIKEEEHEKETQDREGCDHPLIQGD